MAFLWGTVVLISVLLNSYLSLPPIINMIQVDNGFDSIMKAIGSADIALIASIMNAAVSIGLLLRTIIVALHWVSGSASSGKQSKAHGDMNGYGNNSADQPSTSSSSRLGAFTMLCIGLAGGYIASNAIIVNQHVSFSEFLEEKYKIAVEEAASAQQMLTWAHEGTEQCKIKSADVLSELNGKLAARDATIDTTIETYRKAASDTQATRVELNKVRAELQKTRAELKDAKSKANAEKDAATKAELESKDKLISYLKSEMTAMGERFGIRIGQVENHVFEAQENRRKIAVEKTKIEKELHEIKPEFDRLKRLQEGVEKKLKKETESHANTMDEYSRTAVRLGEVENAVKKFLKGESSEEELKKVVG